MRCLREFDILFRAAAFAYGDVELERSTMGWYPVCEGERASFAEIEDPAGCCEFMFTSIAFLKNNLSERIANVSRTELGA